VEPAATCSNLKQLVTHTNLGRAVNIPPDLFNDVRKGEKLDASLRKEFRLKGPADKKKSNEEGDMDKQTITDRRTAAIVARLEDAAQDTEANLALAAEPDAPSIEPVRPITVKAS